MEAHPGTEALSIQLGFREKRAKEVKGDKQKTRWVYCIHQRDELR